jgi:metal-responsive CopG/Arc/MetJ family transcriptional regulator
MASRKFTFTLPHDLAAEFVRRVPSSSRSQYVATAIAARLRDREEQLARVCEVANNSADVRAIEESFDALADESDTVQEPW